MNGSCFCSPGYAGTFCEKEICLNDCMGNGACIEGKCYCKPGFKGDDCSLCYCTEKCENHGI